MLRYNLEMYQATHMRATPYLAGIAFAYFMIKFKDVKIEMKWVSICCILTTDLICNARGCSESVLIYK
jgi:hypothetical protein